jgi:hypothetical protein
MKLSERIAKHCKNQNLIAIETIVLPEIKQLESDSQMLEELIEMMTNSWAFDLISYRKGACKHEEIIVGYYMSRWGQCSSSGGYAPIAPTPREAIAAAIKEWKKK